MQEEIEQKTFNIMISTTKLSARTVLRAVKAAIRLYQSKASQGKQSVRTLLRQNRGVSSVEISKTGIRGLERYAKKYGIDYAIRKDTSEVPPRYLVFFKAPDERFASMRELHRRGKTPDPEHYEVTYYADLPAMWQDVPNNEVLEELFQVLNLSRPQDFEGHSLSVSDVIALKRNGNVSVHYVDSIGFKDLQGFLDKQPERPSVPMNLKEKCDAPKCNPTVCRKARDEHEL